MYAFIWTKDSIIFIDTDWIFSGVNLVQVLFVIKNMVDASSKRDIEEMSVYQDKEDPYSMPKLFLKNQYCVACAIHARIVRVRSGEDRRIRYISKYRYDHKNDLKKGLYRVANQRGGDSKVKTNSNKEE